jgi:hypothetical protein
MTCVEHHHDFVLPLYVRMFNRQQDNMLNLSTGCIVVRKIVHQSFVGLFDINAVNQVNTKSSKNSE